MKEKNSRLRITIFSVVIELSNGMNWDPLFVPFFITANPHANQSQDQGEATKEPTGLFLAPRIRHLTHSPKKPNT
jgi:hypothetical protein